MKWIMIWLSVCGPVNPQLAFRSQDDCQTMGEIMLEVAQAQAQAGHETETFMCIQVEDHL